MIQARRAQGFGLIVTPNRGLHRSGHQLHDVQIRLRGLKYENYWLEQRLLRGF